MATQPDTSRMLLSHIDTLRDAFAQAQGDAGEAYRLLAITAPEVATLPWNTFRTRAKLILDAWEAGRMAGLAESTARVGEDQIKSDRPVPSRLEGWSLNQHAKGYWRAFRKVAGKSRCVYLGTRFNLDEARDKLAAKNSELGVSHGHAS